MNQTLRGLCRSTILTLAATFAAVSGTHAQVTHVRQVPHFSPDGRIQFPFSNLGAATYSVVNNGEVRFQGGTFNEFGIITKPMLLTSPGTTTNIGPAAPVRTTFTVTCYNTHLFGQDIIPGLPRWKDDERAAYIGLVTLAETTDVYVMQEVWDPDLFASIRVTSGYPSGFYGADKDGLNPLNSGLFTMSRLPLSSGAQVIYDEENGTTEALASKGFTRVRLSKDGFPITLYNTHTQSGDSDDDKAARAAQLNQLAGDIIVHRLFHPDDIVIVAGDFNVQGEQSEFYGSMQTALGANGAQLADGATNRPNGGQAYQCTSCANNPLRQYFNDEDSSNKRLDYIFYINSRNGVNRVVPLSYEVKRPEIPQPFPALSGSGLTTRVLSDHDAIKMVFELQRNN